MDERANKFLEEIKPKPALLFQEYNYEKRCESFQMIAKAMVPNFILNDENKSICEDLIRYFAADQTGRLNVNKGLYVYGKVGCGKTTLFRIIKQLNAAIQSPNDFHYIPINKLIEDFSKYGFESFKDYDSDHWGRGNHYLLDDIGQSASSLKHFGNSTDVVAEFIQRRYNAFTLNSKLTFITTNMEPTEIKEQYSEFISSRMREMFNIILFPGNDKRK